MTSSQLDRWGSFINRVGFPVVVALLLLWWLKPMAERVMDEHLTFLHKSGEAVEKIAASTEEQSNSLKAVVEAATDQVNELTAIRQQQNGIGAKVDEIHRAVTPAKGASK